MQGLFTSFWGRFGGALHIHMAILMYVALGGWMLLAVLGWARRARQVKQNVTMGAVLVMFALFWSLMLAWYVRWTLTVLGTDQARQLFPGLPLLAVALAVGIEHRNYRYRDRVLRIWSGGSFTLALAVLIWLDSLYAPSSQNLSALPRLGGLFAPSDFGGTIRVIDHSKIPTNAAPGAAIPVEFYWQAIDNPKVDYWLLLQLVGTNGVIANQDGVPTRGALTTDWWLKGQVFTSNHTLVIPSDAAPGTYTLRLGLHPFGKWEWLAVNNREMLDLGIINIH